MKCKNKKATVQRTLIECAVRNRGTTTLHLFYRINSKKQKLKHEKNVQVRFIF